MVAIHRLTPLEKTPKGRAKLALRPGGKPRGRLTGSHITDLAVLGKCIILTPDEARRFNARAYGYTTNHEIPRVTGYSDASGELTSEGILFLKR